MDNVFPNGYNSPDDRLGEPVFADDVWQLTSSYSVYRGYVNGVHQYITVQPGAVLRVDYRTVFTGEFAVHWICGHNGTPTRLPLGRVWFQKKCKRIFKGSRKAELPEPIPIARKAPLDRSWKQTARALAARLRMAE